MRQRSSVAPSGWCGTLHEKADGPSTSSAVGWWCGCRASATSTIRRPPSISAVAVCGTPMEDSVPDTSAVSRACRGAQHNRSNPLNITMHCCS